MIINDIFYVHIVEPSADVYIVDRNKFALKLNKFNYFNHSDKLMIERIIYENNLKRMPIEGNLFISEGLIKDFFESFTYFYDRTRNSFYFYIYSEVPRNALFIPFKVFENGVLSLIIFNHLTEESKIAYINNWINGVIPLAKEWKM